jgi:Uma2 family endonuclease
MSATLDISVPEPVVVHFEPSKLRMNDDEFFQFCQLNPELRIERTSEGDIIVLAPTGGKTGRRNSKLIAAFGGWAEKDGSGQFFDPSTEFILPNRAGRARPQLVKKRTVARADREAARTISTPVSGLYRGA